MSTCDDGFEQLTFLPILKRCTSCGELKPTEEYHRKRAARDGLQSRCRACNIAGAKKFPADNTDRRARIGAWVRRVDKENKARALDYLRDHPRVDCGEGDPVVVEFDHRGEKRSGVAELLHHHVPWDVVAAEVVKCDVRCANCHRRKTAREHGWFRTVARADEPREPE